MDNTFTTGDGEPGTNGFLKVGKFFNAHYANMLMA
jgi:hypothetical protein